MSVTKCVHGNFGVMEVLPREWVELELGPYRMCTIFIARERKAFLVGEGR